MPVMACIYCATNSITGHRYIGVTARTLARRQYEHEWFAEKGLENCSRFYRALRKYGREAFKWEILAEIESYEAALAEEARLIADRQPEYNISSGGRGPLRIKRSKEFREKISRAHKGRVQSPETIAKRVAKLRGQKRTPEQRERIAASMRGRVVSDEARRNQSLAHMGNKHTDETRAKMSRTRKGVRRPPDVVEKIIQHKRIPVVAHPSGDAFASMTEAAKAFGVTHSRIFQLTRRGGRMRSGVWFTEAAHGA